MSNDMRNIKLVLQYDGRNYHGFQKQPKLPTICGVLEKALFKLTRENPHIIYASRTDKGAHAYHQVVNFKTYSSLSVDVFEKALNALLPKDIVVCSSSEVPLEFHARFSAKSRTYLYLILNRKFPSPFHLHSALFIPYRLSLERMKEGAKYFLGEHDFTSFTPSIEIYKNPNRTINRLDIKKEEDFIHISITSKGFMRGMIRTIVGTLLDVGRGKLEPSEISKIVEAKDRRMASETVPSHGLYLMKVEY
ncbi:MAG: tRNA pseudouridine(38-40) synthase TruA [bacterium]|nr:tRNA pseudouridine(38-40) synthase TruA [bacterium]